jgi:glycosyltransferase involved in cell wall biosynthesis
MASQTPVSDTDQITKTPQVSIGMPVYNGEPFIRDALDSLLAQTFTDFELIISDNASTDGTEAICREYAAKDDRIRYVRQAENRGSTANFQFVLDEAGGEYFMWAAADDIKSSDFIEQNFCFLEANEDYVLSVSPVKFEDRDFDKNQMGDFSIEDESFDIRMLKFFTKWHANGRFYSLIRRQALLSSCPLPDYLGGDWMVVINLLRLGRSKRISDGYVILGHQGESNTTNVFSKYNKNLIYFLLPFKDLIVDLHRNHPEFIARQGILLYMKLVNLSYKALKLNIIFTLRGRCK